jgi:serine/threonine protein kinase
MEVLLLEHQRDTEWVEGSFILHQPEIDVTCSCRLDMNHVIKVADFGLSVAIADEKNYFRSERESGEKLPVKWMAPESLLDRKFSELSDVVSY